MGQPHTIGVRPQDLGVAASGAKSAVEMGVYALERLGKETVVILQDRSGNSHRMLVPPRFDATVGGRVHVELDPSRAFLFNE